MEDLVIPLGNGSGWADNELRYALRSWHTHYPDADPLIIGSKPRWYRGRHLPFRETGMLNANTNAKLLSVLDILTDTFIWSADDIYLLDTPKWGPFRMAQRPTDRAAYYWKALPNGPDCELHIPARFNREKMRRVLNDMPAPKRIALRSSYFADEQTTPMLDVKFKGVPPPGLWGFSSMDHSHYSPDFRMFLQVTFPIPSPWE